MADPLPTNCFMHELAVGAVFQFGWHRDGYGLKWVKVSNRYARNFGAANQIPALNAPLSEPNEEVAMMMVTCLGNEASYVRID